MHTIALYRVWYAHGNALKILKALKRGAANCHMMTATTLGYIDIPLFIVTVIFINVNYKINMLSLTYNMVGRRPQISIFLGHWKYFIFKENVLQVCCCPLV